MSFFKKVFGKKEESAVAKNDEASSPVNVEEEFQKAMGILSKFRRTAYLPQAVPGANTFSSNCKTGGFPYLRHAQDWPLCPNCNKNMQLFLQLNLENLPERKGKGLVQLFYCTTSEPMLCAVFQSYLLQEN